MNVSDIFANFPAIIILFYFQFFVFSKTEVWTSKIVLSNRQVPTSIYGALESFAIYNVKSWMDKNWIGCSIPNKNNTESWSRITIIMQNKRVLGRTEISTEFN